MIMIREVRLMIWQTNGVRVFLLALAPITKEIRHEYIHYGIVIPKLSVLSSDDVMEVVGENLLVTHRGDINMRNVLAQWEEKPNGSSHTNIFSASRFVKTNYWDYSIQVIKFYSFRRGQMAWSLLSMSCPRIQHVLLAANTTRVSLRYALLLWFHPCVPCIIDILSDIRSSLMVPCIILFYVSVFPIEYRGIWFCEI